MFIPIIPSNSSAERLFSPCLLVEGSNTLLFGSRRTGHEWKRTILVDFSQWNPFHGGWVRRRGLEYRSCFCSQSSGANPKFLTCNFTDLHQGQFSWYLLSVDPAALILCPSFTERSYCIQSSELGILGFRYTLYWIWLWHWNKMFGVCEEAFVAGISSHRVPNFKQLCALGTANKTRIRHEGEKNACVREVRRMMRQLT